MRSLSPLVLGFVCCASLAFAGGPTPGSASTPTAGGASASAPATTPAPAAAKPTPPMRLGADAVPNRYAATLRVDPSAPTFSGSVDVDLTIKQPTALVWMHATDLAIDKAWFEVAGKRVPATPTPPDGLNVGFATAAPLAAGPTRLHVEYHGKLSNNESRGLFHEQDYGRWYAGTQMEPIYARRVVPCFDEPGFKTPWQLTLDVDNADNAFSNTYPDKTTRAGKRKLVHFAATPPIPTYLLAFAVGPFDVVDAGRAGKNKVPLRLLVPHGRAPDAGYAAKLFPQIVERLEAYFGIPYPFPKLDIFSMPLSDVAMENVGLIMTPESTLVAKASDRSLHFEREFVELMLHEIGHQWFGDYVTCAWWDDVWLNESFATWITTKLSEEWHPEWHHGTQAAQERDKAMGADQLATARKIRQPVRNSDDILNYVDAITYEKGSSVLNMFEGWIGADKWRTGIHDYLTAHKNGNATFEDFVAALSRAAGHELMPPMASFVDHVGVPLVSVALSCSGAQPTVTLSQERYVPLGSPGSAQQSWQLPVCMSWSAGGKVGRSCTLLTQPKATVTLDSGGKCPDWLQANEGARGYYRTYYQGDLLGRLMKSAVSQQGLASLLGLSDDLGALTRNGKLPMADALATVPPLAADPHRELVLQAAYMVVSLRQHLLPAALRPNYVRLVQQLFGARARTLGWKARPEDDEDTRLLRAQIVPLVADAGEDAGLRAQATELAQAWLHDHAAVAPDVSEAVLETGAIAGGAPLFDAYLEAARHADRGDRDRLLRALTQFRQPALTGRLLDLVLDPTFDAREMAYLPLVMAFWPDNRAQVWDFVQTHFDALVKRLSGETVAEYTHLPAQFCDEPHRAQGEAFFNAHMSMLPGGPRLLSQSLERARVCEQFVRVQSKSTAAFLGHY